MQEQTVQVQRVTQKNSRASKRARKIEHCDECASESVVHPDHSYALPRIRRIQGQLSGVEKMIEARRYCPDILIQTRAIYSAVRALEATVLETHVRSCVKGAMLSKNGKEVDSKIGELMGLFLKT